MTKQADCSQKDPMIDFATTSGRKEHAKALTRMSMVKIEASDTVNCMTMTDFISLLLSLNRLSSIDLRIISLALVVTLEGT